MDEQLTAIGNVVGDMHARGTLSPEEHAIIMTRVECFGEGGWDNAGDLIGTIFAGISDDTVALVMNRLESDAAKPADSLAAGTYGTRRMVCKALHHHTGFPRPKVRIALERLRCSRGYQPPAPKEAPHRIGPLHRKGKMASATVKHCPDNEVFDLATLAQSLFPDDAALAATFTGINWGSHQVEEDRRAITAYRRECADKAPAEA